jgi:regulator of sigma E protease
MSFFFYYFFPFIVVLGVLIFFHELGHFLVAKQFGVKVLKFSLGFGYKLVGKRIGETEYLISTVPLGGYVKMLGENDDDVESVPPDEAARAFTNQHVLKRIAIVAAGPIFNLILALILFCGLYLISGSQIMTAEIGQVREGSPAAQAGLQKGDVIVALEGEPIRGWSDIKARVQDRAGIALVLTVDRNGEFLSKRVVPEEAVEKNIFGEEIKTALIGIVAAGKYEKIELGPWEAVKEAFLKTWEVIRLTCLTVVKLIQRVTHFDRADDGAIGQGEFPLSHSLYGRHQHQFGNSELAPRTHP